MTIEKITNNIFRIKGSVCAGLIVKKGKALLIDAPQTPEDNDLNDAIQKCGANYVERVLLTQHQALYSGGIEQIKGNIPNIYTSNNEAVLFESSLDVWAPFKYFSLSHDTVCEKNTNSIVEVLSDDEELNFYGITIRVIRFAACSIEDLCYIVDDGEKTVAFCGGLMMAGGILHDLYSFQKAMNGIRWYHGHIGGFVQLLNGLEKLRGIEIDMFAPAFGNIDNSPKESIDKLIKKVSSYGAEYARYSAMKHYFPESFSSGFESKMDSFISPDKAKTVALPNNVIKFNGFPSLILISKNKKALLIDAGSEQVIDEIEKLINDGVIQTLDLCWVSHYHGDHVAAMDKIANRFNCNFISTKSVAEIVNYPDAYLINGLYKHSTKINIVKEGEYWEWEEFNLCVMHFPGQTLYDSALHVKNDDVNILFVGDSLSPTGLDDYCSYNRNFTGNHRGYKLCLDLIDKFKPELIVNSHQFSAIAYDSNYISCLRDQLNLREKLLAQLLPGDIGIGLDSQWLRAWPYSQISAPGGVITLFAHITSHGKHKIKVLPILPEGWSGLTEQTIETCEESSGSVFWHNQYSPPDSSLNFQVKVPCDAKGLYAVPYRCWLDGEYLGNITQALIDVRASTKNII